MSASIPPVLKRVFLTALALVGAVIIAAVVLFVVVFTGNGTIVDGAVLEGGAITVKDGHVSAFIVPLEGGRVALIDTGNNPATITAALEKHHFTPNAVTAIFLTHGHHDHTAGCRVFAGAEVYALAPEVPIVEGRAQSAGLVPRLFAPKPSGCHVTHPLQDGEKVSLDGVTVEAFAVPGHTVGSAVYLVNGALFFGDSADATSGGKLVGAKAIFSDDVAVNHDALGRLAERLMPRAAEIKTLAFAHTGTLSGLQPLLDFVHAP